MRDAAKRNINFEISIEYAWDLFLKQNRKCALSGLELNVLYCGSDKYHLRGTASLDRIDSTKGYVEGNVQWVHKKINMMKSDIKLLDFICLCHIIAKNKPLEHTLISNTINNMEWQMVRHTRKDRAKCLKQSAADSRPVLI